MNEPIAIIGMACRFAGGVDSPQTFWTLLRDGGDVIGEVPDERWASYAARDRDHATAVRDVTRRGAFLDDIRGFDADFFDITPREAALMDPQQRIVLELAWEALEHAGIAPGSLAGTDAGVFVGIGADDYGRRLLEDLPRIEAWTGIGGAYCAVANRVSYSLDLRGPSVAVDTACSSSLVSIHLAAQALRAGECPVALAGGVLVMAAPGLSLVLDAAGATAPDGRCKSFDASADGYGRGEGGGVIVLKRLSDAHRDQDRVLAVIRGSAVHQDGRTSGIMAPSGPAQAHLMRRAVLNAGIDPATVGYVEAHGTGTRAGDPLEAEAISSVFAVERPPAEPLLIGSVKPNIGHLEAGAGVAGVIKTVLALIHGELPPSLNFTTPNPAIPWASAGLRVVTAPTAWPGEGPRRAGVSGYGYGGTIAHVILEQAPDIDRQPSVVGPSAGRSSQSRRLSVFPLSGASPAAVVRAAERLAELVGRDDRLRLADIGHTLALRRDHLAHRGVVCASDREELTRRLRGLAEAQVATATGAVLPRACAGLVWVFSGHGSQWTGMARGLLATDPVFADVIDQVEAPFLEELGLSPRATLLDDAPQPVDVIQPLIFAVQAALAATWRARGVRPDAVIGHSVGEIAAAVTAGVLTLEQGARLVCRRSVLLRQVAGRGGMVMVSLPPQEAQRRVEGRDDLAVAVAASPESAVISGDLAAIEELSQRWRAEGLGVRPIDSDVAFHSQHMDPLLDPLARAVDPLTPQPPQLRLYSTALADPRAGAARDGSYWAANLRGQVRFAQAVTAAVADGYRLFLEVSPHPVVEHSITETFAALGVDDAFVTHTLRRNRSDQETLLANLGQLYCHGAAVHWPALWPDGGLADLPTMAWQRREHWAEELAGQGQPTEQHDPGSHNLLGGRISVNGTTRAHAWLTQLDRESRPYPGQHPVRGVEIVPAAVLLNTFVTAAASIGPWPELSDVALRVPVSLTKPRDLQVVLQDGTIRLSSRIIDGTGDDKGWVPHTMAAVGAPSDVDGGCAARLPEIAFDEELPTGYVVDRLASLGVAAMGFAWTVYRIRRGAGALEAVVRAEAAADPAERTWAAILDAALSIASVSFGGPPILRMPAHIHRVWLARTAPEQARITVHPAGDDTVDVRVFDPDGVLVARLTRLRYGVLDSEVGAFTHPRRLVHQLAWRPAPRAAVAGGDPHVVVVGPDSALRRRLRGHLQGSGVPHRIVASPERLRDDDLIAGNAVVVLAPPTPSGDVSEVASRAAWLLARTAQRLAGAGATRMARLWCVTEGVHESVDLRAVGQAALWGLGRIIGGEHPDLWGATVDIGRSADDLRGLMTVLREVRGEDVVVVRDGEPTVARLAQLDGDPIRSPRTCEPDGTYLITGGLGVLGLEVTHWLADRGARRIVLAGRRALPPRDDWDSLTDERERAQVEAIRSLERRGITIVTVAVDVCDADAATKLLSPAALGLPPIRGVVHAAGVLDNRAVRGLDEESLRRVLAPKVAGALVLHQLFPPGSVDFFVLFSSCGQLLGLPGQASYAAGNAFLDALAAHRRGAGDHGATSFGWTSWRGLGMSTSSAVIDAELAARATGDISLAEAFGAWELADRYDLGYAAVLRTIAAEQGQYRLPVLAELPMGSPIEEPAPGPAWADVPPARLHDLMIEEISGQVAAETRLTVTELDPRRPLVEMGVDSVMTVRIRRGLERRFAILLPATLFWDRPTIEAVAAFCVERVTGEPDTAHDVTAAGTTEGSRG